jgi:hypothetical protein
MIHQFSLSFSAMIREFVLCDSLCCFARSALGKSAFFALEVVLMADGKDKLLVW